MMLLEWGSMRFGLSPQQMAQDRSVSILDAINITQALPRRFSPLTSVHMEPSHIYSHITG